MRYVLSMFIIAALLIAPASIGFAADAPAKACCASCKEGCACCTADGKCEGCTDCKNCPKCDASKKAKGDKKDKKSCEGGACSEKKSE
jgi:hypothetical protein